MKLLPVLLTSIVVLSCTDNAEIGLAKDVNPESIYYDYRISGEEEKEDVAVVLQYRFGGKNGTTLIVEEPSKVMVDGEQLKTDSSSHTGAFYELVKPAKSFAGNHSIIFIDKNKKEHKETFSYQPFTLAEKLPDSIPAKPFSIHLSNFPSISTSIRLVLSDTSVNSNINEVMQIEHAEIKITAQMLAQLKPGPITLNIIREEDKPLKNPSKEGGRIQISYGIQRQFELLKETNL